MKIRIKAPAKINLCLMVKDLRNDGFHDLNMVMQCISLFDTIDIVINKKTGLNSKFGSVNNISIKCKQSFIPTDERNLIYKITKYIFEKINIKDEILIYLDKMIPTSAGLGGGSSDAASMLLFLNKYYKLDLSIYDLSNIAQMFGSDIPFFLHNGVCICEGRGEKITKINSFNNYYVLIANPNISVSTKDVFTKFDDFKSKINDYNVCETRFKNCIYAINNKNIKFLSENLFNNLEIVTESMHEEIRILKNEISKCGALKSLMSGSGSTVFGIFTSYFKAIECKKNLKKEFPNYFVYVAKPI